jgi:hypothetical protein
MKKKVVFLIRDLNYGGAQRQLVTLVKALHQEDCFDVTVLHFYSGGPLLKDLSDRGITHYLSRKTGTLGCIGILWATFWAS